MKIAVRHSLIVVAILGVVTSCVSLYVLTRLIATTSAQRSERVRDLVTQQLEFQRKAPAGAQPVDAPVALPPPKLGMRAGYLPKGVSVDAIRPELDPSARDLLARSVQVALSSADRSPVVQIAQDGDSGVVAGAALTPAGDLAWTAYPWNPPPWLRMFRALIVTLGLAGLALVVASVHIAVSMDRGATLLKQSLRTLGRNLDAPVPRPQVRELSEVGDGIAGLAAELRHAQQEQARLSRELADRERFASLGRVAAGVAHEVRNPLAAIKLRVDLLRMDPGVPSAVGAELGGVSEEIARLDRLVSDLLVITGRRTGPRTQTDLRKLADQRATTLEPWARDRGVSISIRGQAAACVDAEAIVRVIDNLVRNGVEASAQGGTVEVQVEPEGDGARLVVTDRGPGVDASRVDELFEPFFTTKPEGMGLGLALSKAIATAHGGKLTYRRQADMTLFELAIPGGEAAAP
ncbi:MAG: HAMP domain-containing histidine kinase [Deltaproteobacteria bacterium]|nr:HAMP domain-containing histidine kinase [Deltaproteobacteria bacterium]